MEKNDKVRCLLVTSGSFSRRELIKFIGKTVLVTSAYEIISIFCGMNAMAKDKDVCVGVTEGAILCPDSCIESCTSTCTGCTEACTFGCTGSTDKCYGQINISKINPNNIPKACTLPYTSDKKTACVPGCTLSYTTNKYPACTVQCTLATGGCINYCVACTTYDAEYHRKDAKRRDCSGWT